MADLHRKPELLSRYGIEPCEYHVMATVGYRGGGSPDSVACQSWSLSEGNPRGEFPLADHLAAVASCISHGWLCVLTADDVEREEKRRRNSGVPELIDLAVRTGSLDFTPAGFAAYRDISREVHGDSHIDYNDSGWSHLEDECRFDVIAPTLDLCHSRVKELTDGIDMCVGGPAVVTSIDDPVVIGPWRPHRFVLRTFGYRASVMYRLVEDSPSHSTHDEVRVD